MRRAPRRRVARPGSIGGPCRAEEVPPPALSEARPLAERSAAAREPSLPRYVSETVEAELRGQARPSNWRGNYAKTLTQRRTLRIQNPGKVGLIMHLELLNLPVILSSISAARIQAI